jgi:NACHT domain
LNVQEILHLAKMTHIAKTIPIVAVTQLILSVGIWQLWEQVQKKPVATLIFAFLYECGVFFLTLGQKVWRELESDVVAASVKWIRVAASSFAPGFIRRYKQQIVFDHGIFNVRGLGMLNTYSLKLEQVFVDLRIDPSNPQKPNFDPIAPNNLSGNRPIWDFLRSDSENVGARALAIIGAPGCGKTTLLQHVALTFAANKHGRYRMDSRVPILLFLRHHAMRIARERPALEYLAQDYFSNSELFPTLHPPVNWFAKQLKRGRCIVLLDGLDEIADEGQRKVVSRWADDQIRSYPTSIFILTARPQGYQSAPLFNAHVLEVQPFNAKQVQLFINNWFLANEIMSFGNKDDLSVRQRASRDAKDLGERLRNKSSLHDLTANPLLLTMITMVHRYRGALPGSRVELYSEICEVLLGRWRQTIGVHDRMQSAQKLLVLRPLANHMMMIRERDIKTSDTLSVISPLLETINVKGITPEGFLNDLQATSGLILEREAGLWSFAHLTFQEYLTAAHWLEQKETDIQWHALVEDSWWSETLRLYAAQGDATKLVQACLEVNSAASLTLAAECIEEARSIDPKVLRHAEETLISGVESTTESRRSLASEVHLRRRLKKLQRIDTNSINELLEIDLEYITCADYQLFLNDCLTKGVCRQPDHWSSLSFPPGEAFTPVRGVRASDALAFCEWLSSHVGGGYRIRVPKAEEANRYPAVQLGLAAWCEESGNVTLIGSPVPGLQLLAFENFIHKAAVSQFHHQIPENYGNLTLAYIDNVFDEVCKLDFIYRVLSSLGKRLNASFGSYDPNQLRRLLALLSSRQLIRVVNILYENDLSFSSPKLEETWSDNRFAELGRSLQEAFSIYSSLSARLQHTCRFGSAISLRDVNNLNNFIRELLAVGNLGSDLIRSLGNAQSQLSALDSDFSSATAIDVNLALTIVGTHNAFSVIEDLADKLQLAVERKDIAGAVRLTETFFDRTKTFRDECMPLIGEILTATRARTLNEAQWMHKRFVATILEYTLTENSNEMGEPHYALLTKAFDKITRKKNKTLSPIRLNAFKLYSFLKLTMAREEQKSTALEAIRIVRERV